MNSRPGSPWGLVLTIVTLGLGPGVTNGVCCCIDILAFTSLTTNISKKLKESIKLFSHVYLLEYVGLLLDQFETNAFFYLYFTKF